MPNYKVSVTKDEKKYSIFIEAENEAVLRDKIHKEGYSILTVEEIEGKEQIGNTFIFEAYKNGEYKVGKMAGEDIFKVYVNLVRNLEYNVIYLYHEKDKNLSTEKKEGIIKELKEEYSFHFKDKTDFREELKESVEKNRQEKQENEQFFLKKQLEETLTLVTTVLEKLENLILGKTNINLSIEEKQKLENIYNSIVKLKKSTNISKLRQIGEIALQKIGQLELSKLEESKDEQSRELLNETNKLLKEIGSKEKFVEKDKDFIYQTKQFFNTIFSSFKKETKENNEDLNFKVDKNSHTYIRNQIYLSKYQEKLRENRIFRIKNWLNLKFFKNKELKEITYLKRDVIKQNIMIFNARLNQTPVKYSLITKGFSGIFNGFSGILNFFGKNLFHSIFIFTIFILLNFSLKYFFDFGFSINSTGIYFFLMLIFAYILLSLSKNIFIMGINFAILFFIIILGVINF